MIPEKVNRHIVGEIVGDVRNAQVFFSSKLGSDNYKQKIKINQNV